MSDYSEEKIRLQVMAGLRAEPWQVEMESIDYGEKLGVFYRGKDGVKRASVPTRDRTEDQIAFALLSLLMNQSVTIEGRMAPDGGVEWLKPGDIDIPSTYEGKRGKHPKSCTCSEHKALNVPAQAA